MLRVRSFVRTSSICMSNSFVIDFVFPKTGGDLFLHTPMLASSSNFQLKSSQSFEMF